jgi:hypothetical protein
VDHTETERAPRAQNQNIIETRAAIALVKPVSDEIAALQVAIARLIGVGERTRKTGGYDRLAAAEARALERLVSEKSQALNAQLRDVPVEFEGHGRIRDCLEALDSAAIGAARATFLLGRHTEG